MTDPSPTVRAWQDAVLAAALFAIDPAGLGGVAVRAGAGPARDAWMTGVLALLAVDAPRRRIPCHIEDERLLGGLDLSASLAAGTATMTVPTAQVGDTQSLGRGLGRAQRMHCK